MGHAAHKIPQHNAAELPPTTLTLPNTCLFVLKKFQSSFVTPQSMVKTPIQYIDGEMMAARSERNFRQPQQTKRLGDQRFQSMALLSYCRFYSFFETALCRCRVFFLDNRNVVPYNAWLTTKYDAHINVEICSSIRVVKYLFK